MLTTDFKIGILVLTKRKQRFMIMCGDKPVKHNDKKGVRQVTPYKRLEMIADLGSSLRAYSLVGKTVRS